MLVCGYGRVGKMICDMLDQNFIRYVAIDKKPQRALEARSKGLPVYFGMSCLSCDIRGMLLRQVFRVYMT